MSPVTQNAVTALIITVVLFASVIGAVDYLNGLRVQELSSIEDKIALDTLSLETQFDLLADAPCSALADRTVLSGELNDLAERLSFTEARLGSDNAEVLKLKRQYTLLEIKDYLMMKRLAKECGIRSVSILYFYSNETGACEKCSQAAATLSYLRDTYPTLRVYSFDYNLDLGALKTLNKTLKIAPPFPAYVINGQNINNIASVKEFEKVLPLKLLATSTATSTRK